MALNRHDGFASLDAVLSLLPMMLMLALLLRLSDDMAMRAQETLARQQRFDKLVSIAEYTIKSGAAVHEGGYRYPNLIDESALTAEYAESLRKRAGLDSLYISPDEPDDGYPQCISRLYAESGSRGIRILHVCGG